MNLDQFESKYHKIATFIHEQEAEDKRDKRLAELKRAIDTKNIKYFKDLLDLIKQKLAEASK